MHQLMARFYIGVAIASRTLWQKRPLFFPSVWRLPSLFFFPTTDTIKCLTDQIWPTITCVIGNCHHVDTHSFTVSKLPWWGSELLHNDLARNMMVYSRHPLRPPSLALCLIWNILDVLIQIFLIWALAAWKHWNANSFFYHLQRTALSNHCDAQIVTFVLCCALFFPIDCSSIAHGKMSTKWSSPGLQLRVKRVQCESGTTPL